MAFLMPAFGMLWGALFLDEPITLPMIAGCALVIGGATVVLRPAPRRRRAGYDARCSVASRPPSAASSARVGVPSGGSSPPACSSPRCSARWPPRRFFSTATSRRPRSSASSRRSPEATSGTRRSSFKVWPRPTAELRQVTFRVRAGRRRNGGTHDAFGSRSCVSSSGEVRVSRVLLDRPVLVVRLPATGPPSVPDDPVAAYRGAIGPAVEWLARHAGGLALSVRDGTVDLEHAGALRHCKLDAVTLDGRRVVRHGRGEDRGARQPLARRAAATRASPPIRLPRPRSSKSTDSTRQARSRASSTPSTMQSSSGRDRSRR